MDPQALQYSLLIGQKIAYAFLIVGAIGWLFVGAFDRNPVTALFGEGLISRMIFLLVGAAGLFFVLRRDYYLPFLGEAVLPCASLQDRVPSGATRSLTVHVEPRAKIIYWAAEPAAEDLKHIGDWRAAYQKYDNMGVTTANEIGEATLKVREPQSYTVPFKGRLDEHVHYRVCANGGMIGRVNTVFLGGTKAGSAGAGGAGGALDGFASMNNMSVNVNESPNITFEEGFMDGQDPKLDQAKRMIMTMGQAVPQINQVLSNLQTQIATSMQLGGAEGSEEHMETKPAPIEEAFRSY